MSFMLVGTAALASANDFLALSIAFLDVKLPPRSRGLSFDAASGPFSRSKVSK
jgi:hypothetical protein